MKSKPSSPNEHYQREKARREGTKPESALLEDAKREYLAALEAAAAKGKGGRPKKGKKKPESEEVGLPTDDESTEG